MTVDSVFAFDTNDTSLGFFFSSCKLDIEGFFDGIEHKIKCLHQGQVNEASISINLQDLQNFIFGAYSHGGRDCLLASAVTPYISTDINCTCFPGSFFYTWSCSSGELLGKALIANNCRCYIGYNKKIYIYTTHLNPFINTANYGIKLFYSSKSTSEIIKEMKNEYSKEIDKLYKLNPVIASILMENREALVMHGDDITIKDLIP